MIAAAIAVGRDTPVRQITADLSIAESPFESALADDRIDTQKTPLPGEPSPSDVSFAGRWDGLFVALS